MSVIVDAANGTRVAPTSQLGRDVTAAAMHSTRANFSTRRP